MRPGRRAWRLLACAWALVAASAGTIADTTAGTTVGTAAATSAGTTSAGNTAAASPASAPADALAQYRPDPATAARPPQRIVSMLPSLTETVCALNACERLVGTDRYSNWPDAVLKLPKLGGLDDAQLERIVALKPDLVLASGSARVVGRLQAMGIPVLALEANTLTDTRRVLEAVAGALARPGAGAALWQQIDERINAAAARVPPAWRGQQVYFEIASAPYAAGEASFVGELLARLGMANIVPASLGPFPKLNPEFVVRAQPGVVMAAQLDLDKMAQRPGWSRLAALREHRQCGFSKERFDLLVRPGPRTGEAAELLANCLVGLAKVAP